MKFIDSNIFLEILARKGEKSDRCLRLLEKGKNLWTNFFVIAEIEWVLRSGYELNKQKIVLYLKRILALENLKIDNQEILIEALVLYETINVDLVDCINALLLKKKQITDIYSFDKYFNKFSWLNRKEP